MEESHSYYDFQNMINTSNKAVNERLDLLEIYFKEVLKNNTLFKKSLDNLSKENKDLEDYINWYNRLPLYKLISYKIINKDIRKIYLKQKLDGSL